MEGAGHCEKEMEEENTTKGKAQEGQEQRNGMR